MNNTIINLVREMDLNKQQLAIVNATAKNYARSAVDNYWYEEADKTCPADAETIYYAVAAFKNGFEVGNADYNGSVDVDHLSVLLDAVYNVHAEKLLAEQELAQLADCPNC